MGARGIAAAMMVAALAGIAADAWAQGYPRRGGSGGGMGGAPREGREEGKRGTPPSAVASDPFGALERELPSLEVDLMIKAEQLDPWRVFARDVRDIAEMERARRRHLMALRDAGEKPPTAITFVAALAEEDRIKAEATAELQRHVQQLYDKLDEAQRRTFDRRTIQSQTEPLGPPSR